MQNRIPNNLNNEVNKESKLINILDIRLDLSYLVSMMTKLDFNIWIEFVNPYGSTYAMFLFGKTK